jgi:hypothetical protein
VSRDRSGADGLRLGEIFRFEVSYRLRQPATWIYLVVMVALGVLTVHEAVADGSGALYANAPQFIAQWAVIISLLGMIATAAIFGDAATRDVRTGMHPLVHTTALSTIEYLGGRFLAAFVVSILVLTIFPIVLAITTRMPWLDPQRLGPFRLAAYVQPYFLFFLPNLILTGAFLFTIAALARHTLAAYVGGVALFIGYSITNDQLGSRLVNRTLTALTDPFGIGAIEEVTRYWTVAERNTRLIGAADILLWNRLIWILVAIGLLAFLYHRFRFGHMVEGDRRRRQGRAVTGPGDARPATVPVCRAAGTWDSRTHVRQVVAVARLSMREMARSKALFVIMAWALIIMFNMGFNLGVEEFGTRTWPVTHLVAGVTDNLAIPIMLLIAIFAGELVWKERDLRMNEIADAAPVADGAALAGRFLALVVMLATIQLVFLGAGVLIQALQGYYRFELGLYAQMLLGMGMADHVLIAALAMTVHVVVNHRYVGIVAAVLCYVLTFAAPAIGLRHNLLLYGRDAGWTYSDMNGFGPFLAPYLWFKSYWAAWAMLLLVVARLLWVRRREPGMRARWREARRRLAGATSRAAAVAVALIVGTGGFVFYHTNVLNDHRTPVEAAEPGAAYERRFKQYEGTPQPRIAAASVRVEIHPEDGAADLRGSFTLVNRTAKPVDSLHVTINPVVEPRSLTLDRGGRPVLEDEELHYRIYELERPLAPGDSLRLAFDVAYRPRGFPNRGVPTAVVQNGSYFDRRWLPVVGYFPGMEVADHALRRRLGLPPRAPLPDADDAEAMERMISLDDALVETDVVIGTAADQIAITPGRLRRTWTENGRRYFHYLSDAPMPFGLATLSGRYALREDAWNHVALKIYYHPTHGFNLDRMARSMKRSLAYFTEQFGPYPFNELRIVEFPRYESFARAHPHTIAFSEGDIFLQRVRGGDMDLPFFAVAHETAHQWWGGQVGGADVKGRGFLSEGLANYSAMMVVEHEYGLERARDFYDYQMDRYLRVRGRGVRGADVPLLDVETQPHIYYGKGAVVMYTLREHIGAEAVSTALRRYLGKYRPPDARRPTSRDLYAELRAVTPDSLHSLLRDLFEDVILWDVRAEQARVEPVEDGRYRVTLAIEAKKVRADSVGNETEVPMNDLVEIGVFAAGGDDDGPGETLYLERHRVRNGKQTITLTVPREPARAGIDPYHKLIQRQSGDNVVDVTAPGALR